MFSRILSFLGIEIIDVYECRLSSEYEQMLSTVTEVLGDDELLAVRLSFQLYEAYLNLTIPTLFRKVNDNRQVVDIAVEKVKEPPTDLTVRTLRISYKYPARKRFSVMLKKSGLKTYGDLFLTGLKLLYRSMFGDLSEIFEVRTIDGGYRPYKIYQTADSQQNK